MAGACDVSDTASAAELGLDLPGEVALPHPESETAHAANIAVIASNAAKHALEILGILLPLRSLNAYSISCLEKRGRYA